MSEHLLHFRKTQRMRKAMQRDLKTLDAYDHLMHCLSDMTIRRGLASYAKIHRAISALPVSERQRLAWAIKGSCGRLRDRVARSMALAAAGGHIERATAIGIVTITANSVDDYFRACIADRDYAATENDTLRFSNRLHRCSRTTLQHFRHDLADFIVGRHRRLKVRIQRHAMAVCKDIIASDPSLLH